MLNHSRQLLAFGCLIAVLAAGSLVGCAAQDSAQPTVSMVPPSQQGTMTPAARGVIRDQALAAATAGWDAWQHDDAKGMEPYSGAFLHRSVQGPLQRVRGRG